MSEGQSGFKELLEVSNNFVNGQPNPEENIEDIVAAKTRDVAFFSSRSKLLQASCPPPKNAVKSERPLDNALKGYADEITLKLLEKLTVKAFSQGHAVKQLLNSLNENLDPEDVKMKQKVLDNLSGYDEVEKVLKNHEHCLREREFEHAKVSAEWDELLGTLRDGKYNEHEDDSQKMFMKLEKRVKRLEMMKWLVVRFLNGPTIYPWLEDPNNLFISALKVANLDCSVDMLLQDKI